MGNLITSVPALGTSEYEIFIKPLFDDPQINQLPMSFTVGNMPREIFFNDNLDKITGAGAACDISESSNGVAFTKKTLTPIELKTKLSQCYSVVLGKLFGKDLPDGAMRGELTPEVIDFMITQMKYAFNRDLLTLLLLGDTAATPDNYYSLIDGVYTKLKAGSVTAEADGTLVTDAGALTSTTTNTTNFFATMNAVYNSQSRALKRVAKADKRWIWTEALYDQYLNYLEVATQNTAGIVQSQFVTDGLTPTSFKGIPIAVVGIVDERMEEDAIWQSGSPLAVTYPYRAILTTATNHIIYMDNTAFQNVDVFQDKPNDKVIARASALLAYEYGYGELNVIAGF